MYVWLFFFKQKSAYEMRISDWSSDVCSSDLRQVARWRSQLESYSEYEGWAGPAEIPGVERVATWLDTNRPQSFKPGIIHGDYHLANVMYRFDGPELAAIVDWELTTIGDPLLDLGRSEEHTSELQSLMRSSYAVFCLKKKNN